MIHAFPLLKMGEIADMMIEAMQNDGWVGDVRIDPETLEVLELSGGNRAGKLERFRAYYAPKLQKLRDEGYKVHMFTDHHVRINDTLDLFLGYGKVKYKRVGAPYAPKTTQSMLSVVHNFFSAKHADSNSR